MKSTFNTIRRANLVARAIFALTLIGICIFLTSCQQPDTSVEPAHSDTTAENIAFSFVPSEKQTSDKSIVRKFKQRYHDFPPLLAAAATAYPTSVLGVCDLEEMDASVLNGMLYTDENGGTIQQKLEEHMGALLENDATIIELGYISGNARETQACISYITPGGADVLDLFWTDVELNEELCLAISVPESEEIGYFRLSSGFGRIVPAEP